VCVCVYCLFLNIYPYSHANLHTRKTNTRFLSARLRSARALVLQSWYRRQTAVGERKQRRHEVFKYNKRQRDENDRLALDRGTCAVEIQRLYKGHRGRDRFLRLEEERMASLLLTRWWHCVCMRLSRVARRARQELHMTCARCIQRRWRVCKAVRRRKVLLNIRNVERHALARRQRSQWARGRFKDEGAGVVLQRWWKRKARQLASFQTRLQRANQSRLQCCLTIQSAIRMRLVRRVMLRKQLGEHATKYMTDNPSHSISSAFGGSCPLFLVANRVWNL
jgi:hypothetical protein